MLVAQVPGEGGCFSLSLDTGGGSVKHTEERCNYRVRQATGTDLPLPATTGLGEGGETAPEQVVL